MLVFKIKEAKFVIGDYVYYVDAMGSFPNATKTRYYYDRDGLQKDEGEFGDIQYDELYVIAYDISDEDGEGEAVDVCDIPSKLWDKIVECASDNAYYD